tara:strand:+ start:923 stop:1348 length:426 start_codon:yes stop_codon:yes gene_type:complete
MKNQEKFISRKIKASVKSKGIEEEAVPYLDSICWQVGNYLDSVYIPKLIKVAQSYNDSIKALQMIDMALDKVPRKEKGERLIDLIICENDLKISKKVLRGLSTRIDEYFFGDGLTRVPCPISGKDVRITDRSYHGSQNIYF